MTLERITDRLYAINGGYHIQSRYHYIRHDWVIERIRETNLLVDLGCGTANLGRKALEEGKALKYVGMDFSREALKLAKRNLQHLQGRYALIHGDATDIYHNLPIEQGTANAVTITEVLEHTTHPTRVLAGACHLLATDGKLLITMPYKYGRHDPLEINQVTPEQIQAALRRGRAKIEETEVLYTTEEVEATDKTTGKKIIRKPRPLSYLISARKI